MTLKKEIEDILHPENKMLKIAKERLHPPMAPIASETSESISSRIGGELDPIASLPDSKLAIDFNKLDPKYQKWALSLETQRHYYYTKFGITHRKDAKAVKRDLKKREVELDMITLMKKKQAPFYKECMTELKLKLQEKRVE